MARREACRSSQLPRHLLILSLLFLSSTSLSTGFLLFGGCAVCRHHVVASNPRADDAIALATEKRRLRSRVRLLLTAEDENGIAGEGELAAAATEAEAGAETEGQRNAPSEMGLEGKWTVEENEGSATPTRTSALPGQLPMVTDDGQSWGEWAREWKRDPARKAVRLVKKWEADAKREGRLDDKQDISESAGFGDSKQTRRKNRNKQKSAGLPSRGFGDSARGGRATKGAPKHLVVSEEGNGRSGGGEVDWSKGTPLVENKERDFAAQWQGEADRVSNLNPSEREKLAQNLRKALGKGSTDNTTSKSSRKMDTDGGRASVVVSDDKGFGGGGSRKRGTKGTRRAQQRGGSAASVTAESMAIPVVAASHDPVVVPIGGAGTADDAKLAAAMGAATAARIKEGRGGDQNTKSSTDIGQEAGALSLSEGSFDCEGSSAVKLGEGGDDNMNASGKHETPKNSGGNDDDDDELARLRNLFGSSVKVTKPSFGERHAANSSIESGAPLQGSEGGVENGKIIDGRPSATDVGVTAGVGNEKMSQSSVATGSGEVNEDEDELKRLRVFGRGVSVSVKNASSFEGKIIQEGSADEEEQRLRSFGRASARVVIDSDSGGAVDGTS